MEDHKILAAETHAKERTTEDEIKIEQIKQTALLNMQRKISNEQQYAGLGWDKLKKYTETCSAARNLRKVSTQENFVNNDGRKQRSKSVLHDSPFKKLSNNNRKISQPAKFGPKLPAILVDGRVRSSTVGCVEEARKSTYLTSCDGNDRNEKIIVNDENKTVANSVEDDGDEDQLEDQLEDQNLVGDCGLEKDHNYLTVDMKVSEADIGLRHENEQRSHEFNGDEYRSNLSRHGSGGSRLSNLGDSKIGKKGVPRTNIENEEFPQSADVTSVADSLPSIPSIQNKVKDFMNKSLPKAPPQSLKISKQLYLEGLQRRRPRSDHLPEIQHRPNGNFLFSSNLCLNPFIKSDGHNWHYTDNYGQCRYLRVPPTPVLSIEEIFSKDHNDDGGENEQRKLGKS